MTKVESGDTSTSLEEAVMVKTSVFSITLSSKTLILTHCSTEVVNVKVVVIVE